MSTSNGSGLEIAQSNQDLIITKGKKKKRAWIVGGVVGVIVFALIIAAIVLLNSDDDGEESRASHHLPALSLEDYLAGRFYPRNSNATWISDNELIYRDLLGSVLIYNVEKQISQEILPYNTPVLATAFEIELSPDRQFLLVTHDYKKVFRYSYEAQVSIINLRTRATSKLLAHGDPTLRFALWSPVGNGIIYVARFNIFYRPNADSETVKVITTDGKVGNIYNGVTDWVYEEEVFSSNRVVWFSPDGKKLAYAKFNDTGVPIMTIPIYGPPGDLRFQYPGAMNIRYPKPGTRNPVASLYIVDLEQESEHITIPPPPRIESEAILAAVSWATRSKICTIWMNRIQNEAEILTYNLAETDISAETIRSVKEPNGWVEMFTPPIFSKNGENLLLIMSQHQNEKIGSYMHLTMLENKGSGDMRALTSGSFVVTEILGWDEDRNLIFYLATTKDDPGQQHVYSVSPKTKKTNCLSCNSMNTLQKSKCLHNKADFSKKHSHYVLHCNGPEIPEISIYNLTTHKLLTWDENEELTELVRDNQVPKVKRMTFEVAGGFKAQVKLRYSPNMDMSGNVKYPMLIDVYGGPNNHKVNEMFMLDWGSYLAANKSIIYASIDARGSALKGDKMLFALYNKFGTVEVEDQINVTRQIQQTLPYVDPQRTAIWGWSYGGYASAMALATDQHNVFKCGISVAPVTDWALYDSIYTERYMGLPIDNLQAYTRAQLLNKYEGMRYKQYYLIHGTQDDNVHYQQSMLWSKVLEEMDILFRQQSYTDEDHSLHKVYPHLYHSLEDFLDDCFVKSKE